MVKRKAKTSHFEWVLLLVIACLVFLGPNLIAYVRLTLSAFLSVSQTAQINFDSLQQVSLATHDNTLYVSGSGEFKAYDLEGNLLWVRETTGNKTKLLSSQKRLALVEMSRGDISIVNHSDQSQVARKDLGPIDLIAMSNQGTILLKLKGENVVYFLDESLELTEPLSFNHDIIDLCFANESEVAMLSTIQMVDDSLETFVLILDTSGRLLGTSDCEGQIVYSMHIDDYQIFVTDQAIRTYSKESNEVKSIPLNGIVHDALTFRNQLYVTETLSLNDLPVTFLSIYQDDLSGEPLKYQLEEPVDGLLVNPRFIAVHAQGKVTLFDHTLKVIEVFETQMAIEEIQWVNNTTLLIADLTEARLYTVK